MGPARRLQAVVPRWWRPALVAMLVAAVGVVVLGLTLEGGEVFLITAVFLVTVWQSWRLVHASVELDEDGMMVRRSRRRRLAWSDVAPCAWTPAEARGC